MIRGKFKYGENSKNRENSDVGGETRRTGENSNDGGKFNDWRKIENMGLGWN